MESGQENMEREIQILDAAPEDAEGMTNVYYKTWLATYPNKEVGITLEDVEESYKDSFTDEKIKALQEAIAKTPENVKRIVAKEGSVIVGVATVVRNAENTQLRTIYVLPEFQGKGIGKKLWEEAKKFSDPDKDIIVQVATYNQNTIEFYKKVGFVDTGKRWEDDRWKLKSGTRMPEMEMVIKAQI